MSSVTRLDAKTETMICALIARGDTYESIREQLGNQNISISIATLSKVKARNSEAIAFMKNQLMQAETSTATRLVHKSRQILEKRLERGLQDEDELDKLAVQYRTGEITYDEYRIRAAGRVRLSVSEVTSVSKEMFNQSQVEQGKPTSITDNPTAAKQHLALLLNAINNRDDEEAVNLLFSDVKS